MCVDAPASQLTQTRNAGVTKSKKKTKKKKHSAWLDKMRLQYWAEDPNTSCYPVGWFRSQNKCVEMK